jgi:hypothetical protein
MNVKWFDRPRGNAATAAPSGEFYTLPSHALLLCLSFCNSFAVRQHNISVHHNQALKLRVHIRHSSDLQAHRLNAVGALQFEVFCAAIEQPQDEPHTVQATALHTATLAGGPGAARSGGQRWWRQQKRSSRSRGSSKSWCGTCAPQRSSCLAHCGHATSTGRATRTTSAEAAATTPAGTFTRRIACQTRAFSTTASTSRGKRDQRCS